VLEDRTLPSLIAPALTDLGAADIAADVNGDGIPDLIATGSGSLVSVALGNGDGTFRSPLITNTGQTGAFGGAALGDVNGDSIPDLVRFRFDDQGDGTLVSAGTLLGDGDGTFRVAATYDFGFEATAVTAGDFNGDGKLDLVVANSSRLDVLLGNGDGTFRTTFSTPLPTRVVKAADFNGDGKLDLVVVNDQTNSVDVLLGNGDGTFRPPVHSEAGLRPDLLAVGDFNGDGLPDLVTATDRGSRVSVLLGNGDGSFQSARVSDVGMSLSNLTAADLNRDGLADLVATNGGAGTVSVHLGNGDGSFRPAASYAAGPFPLPPAVADFNGDGAPDLAMRNLFEGFVTVLLNTGNGSFAPVAPAVVGTTPVAVAAGDFNGDGIPDLVTANLNSHSVSVLLGNGDGSFRPAVNIPLDIFPTSVAVGDFDGDGKPDIAVTDGVSGGQKVVVLLGNGDGTFQAPRDVPTGRFPGPLVVGDFTGGGIPDLAVLAGRGSQPGVYVHPGHGDGTFGPPIVSPVATDFGAVMAVGDFNGDGIQDLVVTNNQHNTVSVLLGNGGGSFRTPVAYAVGRNPRAVAVGRLRGEHSPLDLVVANAGSDTVDVLLGNGDGSFQTAAPVAVGHFPSALAVADFNRDGVPDLVVADTGESFAPGGTVRLLLGNGDGSFQAATRFPVGRQPTALAVADFNGDLLPDLAVANETSNNVSILLNDGLWPPHAGPGSAPSRAQRGVRPGARPAPGPDWVTAPRAIPDSPGAPALPLPAAAGGVGPAGTGRPVAEAVDRVFAAGTGEGRRLAWALARPRAVRPTDEGDDPLAASPDALFASSHRSHVQAPADRWEIRGLELGLALVPPV
jgi:hypothetical protein